MTPTTLTIGMATHRDFDGVYFTVNALRMYHAEALPRCELVIVDNDPDGPQSEQLRGFFANIEARRISWPQPFSVQYVPYREATGTAAPRDRIFRVAQGDAVLVIDSHVNLWPNSIAALLDWYDANPESFDLVQGPLVYDDFATISTHFSDVWRDGMWGTWDCDERGVDPDAPPFEIPAQGLGLFSCRKSAWLGFNSLFREFGGEEWYIHEKFRQAGRQCLCLPFLRWVHRFSPPSGGRAYPLTAFGKIRNYILGLQELGLPLDRLNRHYVEGLNEDPNDLINRDAHLTASQFAQLARNPERYPIQFDDDPIQQLSSDRLKSGPCLCEGGSPCGGMCHGETKTLEAMYLQAVNTPSDLNEHCDELRRLASQSNTVVEFGMRPQVSTVALLAGQPEHFVTIAPQIDPILNQLHANSGRTIFESRLGSSLDVDIPQCDLLFLDTKHTGEHLAKELRRYAPAVSHWIAMHDTEIFGERGEDGSPGLFSALRDFLQSDSRWRVVHHSLANYGLTVISCDPNDTPLEPCPLNPQSNGQTVNLESHSNQNHPSIKDLAELKGHHVGRDIYIVGVGTSVDEFDPEFFAGRTVIGCDRAFRQFSVSYSVLVEGSELLIREAMDQSTVILSRHPFGNTSFAPRQFEIGFPLHYVFPHRTCQFAAVVGDNLSTDEIVVSNSTIPTAMHIAAYLGAKNIFLCGLDCSGREDSPNNNGFQNDSQTFEQLDWERQSGRDLLVEIHELRSQLSAAYGCRIFAINSVLAPQMEGQRFVS